MHTQDTRTYSSGPTYKVPQRRGMSAMLRRLAARRHTGGALVNLGMPASYRRLLSSRSALVGSLVVAAGVAALPASAATLFWDGGTQTVDGASQGGTGTWSTSVANWDNGSAEVVWPGIGNTATFGGVGGTVTLGTAISADSISLGSNNYTLATDSGALTLATGITTTSNYHQIGGANGLVLSAGAQAFNITGGLRISTPVSGAGTITKTGAGMVSFSNTANSFSGKFIINQGSFGFGGDGTFGAVPGSFVADSITLNGGTLVDGIVNSSGGGFDNGGSYTINANRGITLGNSGGTIQVGYGSGTNLTVAGVITGTGTLTKTDSGILALTGANTYTGTTTISGGTLQIGNGGTTGSLSTGSAITDNGALIFNRSNTVTQGTDFANVISGNGSVTQAGTGTLILTGTNTYTGTTNINSGSTLQVGNGGATGSLGSTTNIVDNGTLVFNLSTQFQTGGNNPIISGSGAVTIGGTAPVILTGANTYTGTTTINNGATLQISANGSSATIGTGSIVDNGALIFARASNPVTVSNAISGSGSVAVVYSGTATLAGANSYSGGTKIGVNSGNTGTATVITNTTSSLGTGLVTLATGGTLNLAAGGNAASSASSNSAFTLNTNGTGAPTNTGGVLTLTDDTGSEAHSAFVTTAQNLSNQGGFTSSFIYQASGNKQADGFTFTIQNDPKGNAALGGSGGALGYGATTGPGTAAITKSGAAAFSIFGGSSAAFGTNGSVPGKTTTGTVNLASGNPIKVDLSYNGVTQVLTQTLTDQATNATDTRTYANVDFQSLLGGTSGYVGFTGATGGLTATQMISNFSFNSAAAPTQAYTNAVAVTGNSTINVTGALTASVGNLSIGANTLNVTSTDATASPYSLTTGATTLTGNATFNVANSTGGGAGNLAVGAISGGANGLTKTGAGALTLSGANTYTGGTTVSAGTLALAGAANSNNATGTGNILVTGSGSTLLLGADNQIANTANLELKTTGGSNVVLSLADHNETLGTLTEDPATIDFGSPTGVSNTLQFADSHLQTWSGTLSITNYQYSQTTTTNFGQSGFDHLFFGSSTAGLTSTQLSQISFVNPTGLAPGTYGATMLSSGEIAPTPEPGSVIPILVGMAGLGVLIARKRKANTGNCQNELAQAV